MAETTTTRLALVKPTPGTNEPVDIADHLNANWDKIDAAIGATVCTSGTRPATPYDGQFIRETDTRRLLVWNATQSNWDQILAQGGTFAVLGGGATATLRLYTTSPATANRAIAFRGSGDSTDRYIFDYDGAMQWGSGTSGTDVSMYRVSAGKMQMSGQIRAGTSVPREIFLSTPDTTSSVSYVALTSHGISFVGPPSGAVYVYIEGALGTASTSSTQGAYLGFEVRTGGTVGSGTVFKSASDNDAAFFRPSTTSGYKYATLSVRRLVDGLTEGSTYNVRSLVRATDAANGAAIQSRYALIEPVYSL